MIQLTLFYSESEGETLLKGLGYQNATEFVPILDAVDWTPEAVQSFKDSVLNTPRAYFCIEDDIRVSEYYHAQMLHGCK